MKKIMALTWCALLCVGLLVYSFVLPPQPVQEPAAPTQEATEPSPQSQVCFLNTDPHRQEVWETLAQEFTAQSGVEVTVLSGFAINERESEPWPTLFTASAEVVQQQKEVCLDLTGTGVYAQLASADFAYGDGETIWAVACEMEPFGLIYNTSLLARAGYTRSDINSFADLQAVCWYITENSADLGFTAFANTDGSFADLLCGIPGNWRGFYDLCIANDGQDDIRSGQAVFTLGTAGDLAQWNEDEQLHLDMLPLYYGAENESNQSFCAVVTSYWCVRADADQEEIQGALAFLNYLVSPRVDGTVPVDDLQMLAPYRQAIFADNTAHTLLRGDIAAGKECVVCGTADAPEGLAAALSTYAADPTDENWTAVEDLLK